MLGTGFGCFYNHICRQIYQRGKLDISSDGLGDNTFHQYVCVYESSDHSAGSRGRKRNAHLRAIQTTDLYHMHGFDALRRSKRDSNGAMGIGIRREKSRREQIHGRPARTVSVCGAYGFGQGSVRILGRQAKHS